MFQKPNFLASVARSYVLFCGILTQIFLLVVLGSTPSHGQSFLRDAIVLTQQFSISGLKSFSSDEAFNATNAPDKDLLISLAGLGDGDAKYGLALLSAYPFLYDGALNPDKENQLAFLRQAEAMGVPGALHSLLFNDLQAITSLMVLKFRCDFYPADGANRQTLIQVRDAIAQSIGSDQLRASAYEHSQYICPKPPTNDTEILVSKFLARGYNSKGEFTFSDRNFYEFLANTHIELAGGFFSIWDTSENARANALYSIVIASLADGVSGLFSNGVYLSDLEKLGNTSYTPDSCEGMSDDITLTRKHLLEGQAVSCIFDIIEASELDILKYVDEYRKYYNKIATYFASELQEEDDPDFVHELLNFQLDLLAASKENDCRPLVQIEIEAPKFFPNVSARCGQYYTSDFYYEYNKYSISDDIFTINALENIIPYLSSAFYIPMLLFFDPDPDQIEEFYASDSSYLPDYYNFNLILGLISGQNFSSVSINQAYQSLLISSYFGNYALSRSVDTSHSWLEELLVGVIGVALAPIGISLIDEISLPVSLDMMDWTDDESILNFDLSGSMDSSESIVNLVREAWLIYFIVATKFSSLILGADIEIKKM